jgi:RNA polymerase sigma factor (sigma-70 family)
MNSVGFTHLSDADLWLQIQGGQSAAWKELVVRYQPLVYTVATRAGLSMADAQDCFQQTWVKLHQYRNSIKDPTRLAAWLVTTAKREAIRLKERAGRFDDLESAPDPADPDPLPDEQLDRSRRQAQLEIGLSRLDERCRKLLTAMFFADHNASYEEIAAQVGIAPNSMGPIRQRCLDRLKKFLVDLGYSPVRNQ